MIGLDEIEAAAGRRVSRETIARLNAIVDLVLAESTRQNLISARTVDDIWSRHVLDSVQLLRFGEEGRWLDLGTGAGFPGLVIAAFGLGDVVLVEERRLRHEFLLLAADALGLTNVTVAGSKLERVEPFAATTISARAFAPLDRIFSLAHRFSTEKTRWVLPKGRNARVELESAQATWHGEFRLEPSVTDPSSAIIVAENVRPRDMRA